MSPLGTTHSLGRHTPGPFAPREVRAWLPKGLTPNRDTPALYVFDGQNAFASPNAPHGGWRLEHALATLDPKTHALPLVIAIPSTSARMTELCPYPDREGWGGGGDALLDWLTRTLMPQVRERFGLQLGPLHNVLGGTSMGGLLALHGHLTRPGEFGGALALSPSLWPADFAPMHQLTRLPKPPLSRIYLDAGGREAEGRMLASISRFAAHLAERGYPPSQLSFVSDPAADHLESEWAKRLPAALRFMFTRS